MTEKTKSEDSSKLDIILNAAQKRFGHYGLCKTTMNEIAADVGMGKASLYYYFPDKEAVFQAVIQKEQEEFLAEMKKHMNAETDAASQLKHYVKYRLDYFQNLLNLSKLKTESFFNSKPIFGKVVEDFYKLEIELVGDIIQTGIDKQEFREVNKEEYALLLMNILQGLRLIRIKYKAMAEFDSEDVAYLKENNDKVICMFIKDLKK
ncbi:MAG: TetR/AcrR family transcriptional regulator [Sporocytophaga sp.]|uniref:TetR/AcrR family transcriptional regulator n=1 Tax=Sporocytophaga sp. TaxID=2231183 RepID=UPI001B15BA62|nr:TetR/AcrR family transcriptional regulator [Sporocytophaga sp.]MBO9703035.1 TetR/AcrR family transcriptional regulator [Sporocytophaga sp.]